MTPPGPPAKDHPSDAASASERPAQLFLYTDGASSGNPGPASAAAILKDADGDTLLEKARAFGPATNNVAEYQALILGLRMAAELRPRLLTIRTDAELVVRQLAGQYKVKAPGLKPLYRKARRLVEPFEAVEIEHISRSANAEADKLARKALEKSRRVDAELPPDARKTAGLRKKFRLK